MSEKNHPVVKITDDPKAVYLTDKSLWAERVGVRSYVGRSSTGAEVRIGKNEGEFSPGELLKLAIAVCNAMSADHSMGRTLGEDFTETVGVSAEYNEEENRYEHFQVEMVVPDTDLDEQAKQKLADYAGRAIGKHCTIGATLNNGATYAPLLTFERPEK